MICGTCSVDRDVAQFRKGRSKCKVCVAVEAKKRYDANPELAKQRARSWRERNPEKVVEQSKFYYNKDRARALARNKKWREDHAEQVRARFFKNYHDDVDAARAYSRQWKANHKESVREIQRRWAEAHPDYHKEKRKIDINYRLSSTLRSRLYSALRGQAKGGSAVRDLGCSIPEFKTYLEARFYPNPKTGEAMTWENWTLDGWHIDHIKPLSAFDLTDRLQFLQAAHHTNLQPLWAQENLSKGPRHTPSS